MANVLFFKTLTKYCFLLFYLTLVSSTSSITYLEYLVNDEFVPIETPSLAVTEGDDITLYCYLDDDLKEKNDNIWWGLSYESNETSIEKIDDRFDIVILGDETNSWSILQLGNASAVHRAFYHCCVRNGSQHFCDSNVLLRIKSPQAAFLPSFIVLVELVALFTIIGLSKRSDIDEIQYREERKKLLRPLSYQKTKEFS